MKSNNQTSLQKLKTAQMKRSELFRNKSPIRNTEARQVEPKQVEHSSSRSRYSAFSMD